MPLQVPRMSTPGIAPGCTKNISVRQWEIDEATKTFLPKETRCHITKPMFTLTSNLAYDP